jgi:hypothetical protein
MTEKTEKPKHSKVTWGTLAMAFFAMVTAVGDGVRSCNEREADQNKAARAETDRVKVDTNIQETSTVAFEDIYLRIEDLENLVEYQDRDLFELRVTNEAQDKLIMSFTGVTIDQQDMVTLEALQQEAREEHHYFEPAPPESQYPVDVATADEMVKLEATKIAEKRTKKRDKPKPKFDFAPPEPQYEQVQQMLKQALPPKRKK